MKCKVFLVAALCAAGLAARPADASGAGASGFFRVRQKENGVWTFVDPQGNDVFLRAVDHVGWTDGALRRAKEAGNPVDFIEVRSNLVAWGFNTQGVRSGNERKPTVPDFPWYFNLKLGADVGATEDPERGLTLNRHVPGTAFPNVFRPGFEEDVFSVAQKRCAPHRDDPLLVGYCIDNELAFNGRNRGVTGHWGLFEAARQKPETNSAHVALMDFLRSRGIDSAENVPMEVREDFCRLVARRYFDVTTRAIRAADPNHLVLGCRFANRYDWTDDEAGKFVDVLSFNCYPSIDLDREAIDPAIVREFHEIHRRSGRPLMVTEWSFPSVDVGYETAGHGVGQRFSNQAQRAKATEVFARTMAAMPFVAGYSYFMYRDDPPGSREETNYGLVGRDGKPFPEITSMFARLQSPEGIAFARPDGVAFSRDRDKWRLEAAGGLVLSGGIGRRELCHISYKGEDFGYATAGMLLSTGVESPRSRTGFQTDWPTLDRVSDVCFEMAGDYRRGVLITGEGSSGDQRFEIEVRVTLLDAADRLRFEIVSIRNPGTVPLLGSRAMLRHFTPFKEIVKSGRNIADRGVLDRVVWGKPSVAEIRSQDGSLSLQCMSSAKTLYGIDFSLDDAGNLHPDVCFTPWFESSRGLFGALIALRLAPGETWHPAEPAYDEVRLKVMARTGKTIEQKERTMEKVVVTVDPSIATGPVKPVNGVGQPPFIGFTEYPMFHYLSEAGIPFSRLHDVGGIFGGGVFVDIPNIFRDFDADETDPVNYDFAFTDLLINGLVENGIEPFFRLGVTIENYATTRRYRIDPPKDYAKWARICEHVIRHYTEGWAEGFHHTISHWEIWNEPENWGDPEKNQMWHGTFEDFCHLYEVASKHLKAAFPHLKIGGFGSCGLRWLTGSKNERAKHPFDCFHAFLKFAREHDCPLDFFSFHSYQRVADMMVHARYVREKLDEAGFRDVQMCLDEWLPKPSHDKLGTALQAAEIAAELIALQNGPVDSAAIYDARCGVGEYSPLFNPLTYKPHKAYYSFMAFNELRRRGAAVKVKMGGPRFVAAAEAESSTTQTMPDPPVYAAAARGNDGSVAVMLANPGEEELAFSLEILGDGNPAAARKCRIIDDGRTWEEISFPSALPPHSVILVESSMK